MLVQIGNSPPLNERKASPATGPAPANFFNNSSNEYSARAAQIQILTTRYRVSPNLASIIAGMLWEARDD